MATKLSAVSDPETTAKRRTRRRLPKVIAATIKVVDAAGEPVILDAGVRVQVVQTYHDIGELYRAIVEEGASPLYVKLEV